MEIELIQQIITMVGGATDSAVMIAVIWIVGGYLLSIFGWVLVAYMLKFVVVTVCKFLSADVDKDTYNKIVSNALISQDKIKRLQNDIEVASSKHQIELEKIKHMYKLLKESKDV